MKFSAQVRRGFRSGTLRAAVWLSATGAGFGAAPGPARSATPPTETAASALSPGQRRAYAEVLKLRPGPARQLLAAEPPTAPGTLLVADCADFVELLVTQDATRYEATLGNQEARLAALSRAPPGPLRDYVQAEIQVHEAVAQLTFGHEVRGAWSLRQAVGRLAAVVARYPTFLPARKTLGLCEFGIGSLPSGYHWFLRLLGLGGSVEEGLRHLRLAATQPNDFQTESQILQALVGEAYYKRGPEALALAERLRAEQPDNLLFSYLIVTLNKRQHHGDAALAAYRARPAGPGYLPLAYLHHLAGDLLLYRGDYAASQAENEQFLREYRGQHYRKDAAFKLYLAAWLGAEPLATLDRYRQQINQAGPLVVEEDIYAQRFYHDAQALNPLLTRARLLTDGGYYPLALSILQQFRLTAATPARDRLEAPYRRARVWQGLGRPDSAQADYQRTLRWAAALGEPPYYFAPQAALQLGYLAQAAGQKITARAYFEQAMAYPRHEYKNSTDQKAKLALRQL
ncbi:MAG: hypothetical protein ACRYFK_20085 [Janthinobacterium lividum]